MQLAGDELGWWVAPRHYWSSAPIDALRAATRAALLDFAHGAVVESIGVEVRAAAPGKRRRQRRRLARGAADEQVVAVATVNFHKDLNVEEAGHVEEALAALADAKKLAAALRATVAQQPTLAGVSVSGVSSQKVERVAVLDPGGTGIVSIAGTPGAPGGDAGDGGGGGGASGGLVAALVIALLVGVAVGLLARARMARTAALLSTDAGVAARQGGSAQAARNARKYMGRHGGRKSRLAVSRMSRDERAQFRAQGGSILGDAGGSGSDFSDGGGEEEEEDEEVCLDEISLGDSFDGAAAEAAAGGAQKGGAQKGGAQKGSRASFTDIASGRRGRKKPSKNVLGRDLGQDLDVLEAEDEGGALRAHPVAHGLGLGDGHLLAELREGGEDLGDGALGIGAVLEPPAVLERLAAAELLRPLERLLRLLVTRILSRFYIHTSQINKYARTALITARCCCRRGCSDSEPM